MSANITAEFTRDRKGQPLAVVDGLPGGFAELRPKQLRELAATLLSIADESEQDVAQSRRLPLKATYTAGGASDEAE